MDQPTLRLDEFLPFRLSYTSNLVSETVAQIYIALFDLRIPEWRIIAVVAEHDGISQQAIGARTRMDKVTVSRAAIALTGRGLLERAANPDDKRSHLLVLSAAGRALYADVAPKALEVERSIFAAFEGTELEAFRATLRRIDAVVAGMGAGLPIGLGE
jgi:DNA-binding MarR family transcriptional regulator